MENNDLNFDNRVPLEELRETVKQIKKNYPPLSWAKRIL